MVGKLTKVLAVAMMIGLIPAWTASQESGGQPKGKAEDDRQDSIAARYIRVKRLLEADKAQKEVFEAELGRLGDEFQKDAADFARIDSQLAFSGTQPQDSQDWRTARDELDRVIRRRSVVSRQVETLGQKVQVLEDVLQTLSAAAPPSSEKMAGLMTGWAAAREAGEKGAASGPDAATPATIEEETDEHIIEAKKELDGKQGALKAAEREVTLTDRGISVFERDITSTREFLETIRDELQAAEKDRATLDAELERRRGTDPLPPAEELKKLEDQRGEADRRLVAARVDEARQETRLRTSERVLGLIRESREASATRVSKAEAEVASAQSRLLFLQSPVAPHRILRWVARKGPQVAGTILGIIVLWMLVRTLGDRAVGELVRRRGGGTEAERESRAETLRRAFRSTSGWAFLILGVLAALEQAGVNVTVLFGGAAVFGAAVAFGAQSLIKDYFSGFMILVENQYSVGHTVRVGDVTGTVEDITLRVLVLRDLQGIAHFIPHNQVAKVSNLTYGWASVAIDVRVPSELNEDEVMESLMEIARGLQDDPRFRMQLIGKPEMLGIDSLNESSMVIKLLVKTRPLSRWQIKRELLRRVKKAFDAQHIKIM